MIHLRPLSNLAYKPSLGGRGHRPYSALVLWLGVTQCFAQVTGAET